MSLHITPEMMEATYELLLHTLPFKRWKLPSADEVSFVVIETDHFAADYNFLAGKTHRIRINNKWIGSLPKLLICIAHEMVHMRLECECVSDQLSAGHGPPFQKLARLVCKHHGFEEKSF